MRPASPIPLHAWAIDSITKPRQAVQVLTQEQFQEMYDRLNQAPPVPAHSPSTKPSSPKFPDHEKEHIYEVAPPDARRPASLMPPGREQSITVYEVPPRRSIKRKNKRLERKTKSDLGLDKLSNRYWSFIEIFLELKNKTKQKTKQNKTKTKTKTKQNKKKT